MTATFWPQAAAKAAVRRFFGGGHLTLHLASAEGGKGGGRATGALDRRLAAAVAALLCLAVLALTAVFGAQQGLTLLLGSAIGLVLFHANFGFAGAWRRLLSEGRGEGLRAQMLMLAVTTAVFLPLLAAGSLFGRPLAGAVAPAGVSVLVGACLFGIGMQLGGACASGTLYRLGGGAAPMAVTLVFFMAGSLLGSAHLPWWLATPSLGAIALPRLLGLWPALLLQLAAFAAIALASLLLERRLGLRPAARSAAAGPPSPLGRFLRGPWPLAAGALGLALLNLATLLLTGHPWTVSFGYTLWGAKLGEALGLQVASWPFWTWPYAKAALEGSIFAETTSLMNMGIVIGALLAALLAGGFRLDFRAPPRLFLGAACGGVLMGYGARLAFGCNVGAYFSGIASGSLHGWLWLASALVGTAIGLWLRPLFGLATSGPFRR